MSRVFIATETFSTVVDGSPQVIHKGVTHVREGHPLLKRVPENFQPVDDTVQFDVEVASKAPGEKRGEPKPVTRTKRK
jgi:hypothetical protein